MKDQSVLKFQKESVSELNVDRMRAVDSGNSTLTAGTTSTVIIAITKILAETTVTY